MGKGMVDKICQQVIMAIQSSNLQITYIRWPSKVEKEKAKKWIEEQVSLSEWQNRFCMVDDTLILLYWKPSHYEEIFFDQKSNYFINI